MSLHTTIDKTKIQVVKKGQEPDDILYWQQQLPMQRLIALEDIRTEYNQWKYGTERRFQRVYHVIKRQRS